MKRLFIVLAAVFIFYFFSGVIISRGFGAVYFAVAPIWKSAAWVGERLSDISVFTRSKQRLEKENNRLTMELENAKLELDLLDLLRLENEELRIEMGREIEDGSRSILAAVLSGPNVPPYESLILDIGGRDGVSVGDRVIYGPNVALGEISQIADRYSKARLYSADGVRTDTLVSLEETTHAVATGLGGGNFFVELPDGVTFYQGLPLLIPGSMYVLGSVDYIEDDPVALSRKAFVRSPANVKKIKFVHVVKRLTDEYPR